MLFEDLRSILVQGAHNLICLQSIEKHPAFILRGNLRVGEQDSRNDSGVHIPEIRLEARAMVVDKLHAEPLSAIDRIFQT